MMNKTIIFIIIGMFLISLTSAADNMYLGKFKQNEKIDLTISCASCTYNNISYISVDGANSKIIIPQGEYPMTKVGTVYNYTFQNTFELGTYLYCGHGDLDGTDEPWCINFDVTPSGFLGTLGFFIVILLLSFGIIIFGYYIEDATVVVLGSFGLYFVGLYVLFNGIVDMKDPTYTWAIGIIVLMLAAYFSIRGVMESLEGIDVGID